MKLDYHTLAIHIHKIELNVSNIEKSLDFYINNLGFTVLKRTNDFVSLSVDHTNEMIRLYETKDALPIDRKLGIYHFALLLPTRKDLSVFLKHLIQNQIPITGAADHLVSEAIYLQDPDGIGIEIACDRDQTYWDNDKLSVPMDTLPFDYPGVYYEDSNNTSFTKLPQDTIIGHLHLQVSDLESACDFYHNTIGFEITSKDFGGAVFLADASYHHHLALNIWNQATKKEKGKYLGLESFTIQYPYCEKLIHSLSELKAQKKPIEETLNGYLISDFDSNRIYLEIKHNEV